jgi:hypothetical protein
MKKNRKKLRAGVRGRTKRYLVTMIAIILALTFSTTALAANGNGGGTQQANEPDAQSGATQQPPPGSNGNSSGNGNQINNRNKAKIGTPNLDKIEEAIAALTDEGLKTELTALLSAYQDAWTAKQDAVAAKDKNALAELTDAITLAKATLDAALEAAGVSLDTIYGVPVEALDGAGRMYQRPALDTDKILDAIATLADTNADKETLTGLLNEYQLALAALNAANFASLSEQAQQRLAYMLRHAEEALLIASRQAGLIGGYGRGQFVSGYAYGKAKLDVTSILASIAALDDTDENKANLTALLGAYTAALEAEATADNSVLSEEEFDALRDATHAAQSALIEALELAGIVVPLLQQDVPRDEEPSDEDDDYDDDEEDDEEPDEDDD